MNEALVEPGAAVRRSRARQALSRGRGGKPAIVVREIVMVKTKDTVA